MEDSSPCNNIKQHPVSRTGKESSLSSEVTNLANNLTSSSLKSIGETLSTGSHPSSFMGSHEIIDCENRKDSTNNSGKKPVQDSEDSSYDSDYEVSDGTSHYDVSRTVSDTLGQEFAEYVTISEAGDHLLPQSGISFELDPGYGSRVEFAKKLGYTESQVRISLSKLGPSPSQNELLSELILLDSSNTSSIIDNEDESLKDLDAASNTTNGRADSSSLRHIVIDGSNVAMSHGSNKIFSCRGIELAVDYFKSRRHKHITVFVPSYRKENPKPDDPVSDKEILLSLEKEGILVYTPSRVINNRRLVCYDDRYILKLAVDVDGIVVSNDNYRDLTLESNEFKRVVEERLLMYSFVNDRFMPPEDPLGRNGPKLDQFLSKAPVSSARPCPYGRKCTYGQKCKYYHVTQQKSVSETLRKQAAMKTQSVPITKTSHGSQSGPHLQPISRTKSAIVPMESARNEGSQLGSIGVNPHKKLQRQLSINPVGDPRISQTWRNGGNTGSSSNLSSEGAFTSQRSTTYLHSFPGNPILSEVWSPPGQTNNNAMQQQALAAESLSAPSTSFGAGTLLLGASSTGPQQQSNRTRMYYHLSAIFPEEQVHHVMNLYPEQTDPSFICRVIVSLFK